ncbi:MAG: hypothetical protein KIS74_02855 [Burkholderiales bacterium]|nr:hypothetical protein [Burkholderiales bacterium]
MDHTTEDTPIADRQEFPLDDALHRLAVARMREQEVSAKVREARKAWELENAELLDEAAKWSQELKEADNLARGLAAELFQRTGDTQPATGVTIKLFKTALYDPAKALAWARQSGTALKLDEKAFEKLALSGGLPKDLAEVESLPRVTICTDLAKKLGLMEPEPVEGKEGFVKGDADTFLDSTRAEP